MKREKGYYGVPSLSVLGPADPESLKRMPGLSSQSPEQYTPP